jgi:ferrous iron transport protein B
MNKVLLMGQSNVGKSVIFNRLSGSSVIESNYPGTTVDFTEGQMRLGDEWTEIIDVPGTFSLEPKDKAEEVAVCILKNEKGAIVICVIDSSKIERGLYLTLEIIERGYPVIIVLNMWDVANSANIKINVERLEQILGVPVVSTVATRNEGLEELVSRIEEAAPVEIGSIIRNVGV